MTRHEASPLESAIAELYRGPLNEFVPRRDTLAKELRSAGDREAAAAVKNLRKPARTAWALDLAAASSPDALGAVVDVVDEMRDARNRGVDIRNAIVRLQAAVREFASRAAHFAGQAGQPVETGVLVHAMLAVLGTPDSFSQLRRASLADIPEAGGLDLLAALPEATAQVAQPEQDESALVEARARLEKSQQALREAESKLHAAEQRLREAEETVDAARTQRDQAHKAAETAAALLSGTGEDGHE